MTGDAVPARAGGLKPRATLRCLGLSALIAIAGCAPSEPTDEAAEFSLHKEAGGLILMRDRRTTCEYLVHPSGAIILRADPNGNVTPNCAGSRDLTKPGMGPAFIVPSDNGGAQ